MPSSFRFIHTADIHLDSPLKGLAGQDKYIAERIRTATRDAFNQLVELSIGERADFFIIAGDLYDGDWRDYNTGLFFVRQMGRLKSAGVPVYLLYGNHDAESQITRHLNLPENVNTFGSRNPVTFKINNLDVALHGQSFRQRDIADNLVLSYPDPVDSIFNIGVLHTGLGGIGGHENYAPCALDDLINKGYDYWALGHVHKSRVLNEYPHIAFPGNLQGRNANETGDRGAYIVTVEDGEIVDFSALHSDVVRWALVPVEMDGVASIDQVIDHIRDAIEDAVKNLADSRLLVCRLRLQGSTEIHEKILTSLHSLTAEARSSALGLGSDVAWVERVVVETKTVTDSRASVEREDTVGELMQMLQEASADTDFIEELKADIGEMIGRLPPDLRSEVEDAVLKAAIGGDYAKLIAEAKPYLLARLIEG